MTIPVATRQMDMMDLDSPDPRGRLLLPKDQFCVLSIPLLVDNSLECRCRAIFLDNTVACEVCLTSMLLDKTLILTIKNKLKINLVIE